MIALSRAPASLPGGRRIYAIGDIHGCNEQLGNLHAIIAEDLGLITPDVYALRDQFHLPGTRVLQFAFDGRADNPYLPDNYITNTVVYTGTHDNPTSRGWFEDLPDDQRRNVWNYLKHPTGDSGEAAPARVEL